MDIQTRTTMGQLTNHQTMNDALDYAQELLKNTQDRVWKISFTIPETNERIRLILGKEGWVLEDVYGEGSMRGVK